MQYDIALPREVIGNELIEALKRVASNHGWPYEDEVVAYSVSPNSGSLDVQPKTLQVTIEPKQRMLGIFSDIGEIAIKVSIDEKYSTLTVNPTIPRQVDALRGVDRISKANLEAFVKSLYQELR